ADSPATTARLGSGRQSSRNINFLKNCKPLTHLAISKHKRELPCSSKAYIHQSSLFILPLQTSDCIGSGIQYEFQRHQSTVGPSQEHRIELKSLHPVHSSQVQRPTRSDGTLAFEDITGLLLPLQSVLQSCYFSAGAGNTAAGLRSQAVGFNCL